MGGALTKPEREWDGGVSEGVGCQQAERVDCFGAESVQRQCNWPAEIVPDDGGGAELEFFKQLDERRCLRDRVELLEGLWASAGAEAEQVGDDHIERFGQL